MELWTRRTNQLNEINNKFAYICIYLPFQTNVLCKLQDTETISDQLLVSHFNSKIVTRKIFAQYFRCAAFQINQFITINMFACYKSVTLSSASTLAIFYTQHQGCLKIIFKGLILLVPKHGDQQRNNLLCSS